MIFVPTWQILDILEARPDLNIGVAPVPQALPDSPASWASFWMYAVPANSDSKAAAWNFINFLTTEEAELALYDEASKVRSFGSAHALTDLDSELISNSYLGPLLRSAPYAYSGEIAARAGNRRQVEALEKAVNDVLSGASVKEALEEAKEAVDK